MQLRSRIASEGLELSVFRAQLRDQLMLTRLREREVDARVRVSDLEVDQYLRELQNGKDRPPRRSTLPRCWWRCPMAPRRSRWPRCRPRPMRSVLTRARAGKTLLRWRASCRNRLTVPTVASWVCVRRTACHRCFWRPRRASAAGELSQVIRSGAGFHVLKVIEKRLAGMTVTQSRARHILLRASPQLSETAARDKLNDFKRRIQAGQADFATLARENSQDGSAAGGDLGWASPGQFVPEFEGVLGERRCPAR